MGTWSGGKFMRFGAEATEEKLKEIFRPGGGIETVLTADTYGQGAADSLLGEALGGLDRETYSLIGAVGHDFYEGERNGPKGFPRFTDPGLRGPDEYASYLRMATEKSLERVGVDHFDLLLLHNPDRIGYSSEVVWEGMAALRDDGLTTEIGVAPGPANGFTLDLLSCFDRFGELIDWAMVILNPFEPWPGEMVLEAAQAEGIDLITRVVDYGGLFWGDVRPGHTFAEHDHRKFRPDGWVDAGAEKLDALSPILDRTGLTTMQLSCCWNLAQPAVKCVAPTLIEEIEPGSKSLDQKRAELAAIPEVNPLTDADLAEIRRIGDNSNCMALKGANPDHEGEEQPDRWALSEELVEIGRRWGVDPERDLVKTH